MAYILNYVFAWFAVFTGIFLSLKYVVRKLAGTNLKSKKTFQKLNKTFNKSHIWLGILMIAFGLIHGLNSSQEVLSLNFGTVLWLLGLLLGLNYPARKMLKKGNIWLTYHRVLTLLFLVFIVFHIVDVGGIQIFNALPKKNILYKVESKDESLSVVAPSFSRTDIDNNNTLEEYNSNLFGVELKDGIYTGVAAGYRNGLTVQIEILNNQVIKIAIISHNEKNARFYSRPIKEIPSQIIDRQSLDADTVSGATYTSIGIINAVNEALSKAVISGELPEMKSLPR